MFWMFCYWEPEGSQWDDIEADPEKRAVPFGSGRVAERHTWPGPLQKKTVVRAPKTQVASNFRILEVSSGAFHWRQMSQWVSAEVSGELELTSAWNVRFLATGWKPELRTNGWQWLARILLFGDVESSLQPMTQVIWVVPIPHSSAKPPKLYPVITR